MELARREPIVAARKGRGGAEVYDVLDLTGPGLRIQILAAYRVRLLAGHVPKVKAALVALADQRRARQEPAGREGLWPMLITDVAKPSVVDACQRAGVALLDQRGTCVISGPGVVVHLVGRRVVERRSRLRLFGGKASRVVRYLLARVAFEPTSAPMTAQAFAAACELSYAYTHGVLAALEKAGFVERRSSHGGYRLRDPVGLLRAWIGSGEPTAAAIEGFYAPATTPAALQAGVRELARRTASPPLFTLASALGDDELHVAALPHGVYWNGELQPLIEAFGLRRTTPHNFLVLRPDPLVWTKAGGLLLDELVPPGRAAGYARVALAQVAADFAALPGRGRAQADFLLGVYGKRLPYRLEEP